MPASAALHNVLLLHTSAPLASYFSALLFHRKDAFGVGASTAKDPKEGTAMELGGTMAGVGIPAAGGAAGPPRGGGGAGPLPGPPPLNTPAAMLAMARAGVKLTREQLKGLSSSDRKAAKKARKETKKVG